MAVVEAAGIVVDVASFVRCGVVRLVYRVRVLLQSHVVLLARQSLRVRVLAVRAHVLIVLRGLVRVVRLLLEGRPPLFTDQGIAVLLVLLRVVLEEGGRGGRLRLVVVARVSADVLALVEFVVVLHVLLHGLPDWMVLVVVHDVRVGHVLGVDATASFDHWELLGVQVLVRVRSEAAAHWFLLILLVVPARGQVRQLLLRLPELFIMLLLIRVYAFYLVGASNFNFSSVPAHIVGVLAILGEAICESGPDAGLGQGASILLFEHVLLLPEFFEPGVLQGLTRRYAVVWVVYKQFHY